jgi:hypothetical protein
MPTMGEGWRHQFCPTVVSPAGLPAASAPSMDVGAAREICQLTAVVEQCFICSGLNVHRAANP